MEGGTMYDLTKGAPMPHAEEKIENLLDFKIGKIRDETTSYLFENIGYDEEKLKDFTQKFEDIYYISVSPFDIEKYKDRATIYEILKRYEDAANGYPLEIMAFKIKELSEEEKQALLEKLKKEYEGFPIKLDESRYIIVVGFFKGSSGRSNSYYMEEIKKIYPVKMLS